MGPEAVARQIEATGMQIPGFRREPQGPSARPRALHPGDHDHLGAAVGALAAGADLIGTLGNASGTGVLLTVGIIINLYEAMGREQLMEMNPLLRRFLGGEIGDAAEERPRGRPRSPRTPTHRVPTTTAMRPPNRRALPRPSSSSRRSC